MHAGRVPILTFHALDDRRDVCGFSAGVFRRAVERLRAADIRTVGVVELADALRHGRTLPDRSVAFTWRKIPPSSGSPCRVEVNRIRSSP